jgi:hypothetical protein
VNPDVYSTINKIPKQFADVLYSEIKKLCVLNFISKYLIQKYPNDMQVHALHALRLGLCFKIERGDITVNQGTDIFENMRTALIESKEKHKEKQSEDSKKEGKGL